LALRILPHELALEPDLARAARHESSPDTVASARDGADPIEYGIWWHETLESVPWRDNDAAVAAHGAASIAIAGERGFGARAEQEWGRLLASDPWRMMREPRWTALSEAGILAPLGPERWVDGVIDLVLHDGAAGEVWIVDWKTNRGREGESQAALLARLSAEYRGQIAAYGACAAGFFPGSSLRLWVYSTEAGEWTEVPGSA
jgi:ATP-dependent exoDNAse (exonuclease V) beta subunit